MQWKGKKITKLKQTKRTRKTRKTFRISGRVLDRKSQRGIGGLRVEAWDKDLICKDLVGSAVTNEQGAFQMQFDESYFKEIFLDRRPDLFFKVFRGEELIKSTKDSVLWNVDNEHVEIVIEVDEPVAEKLKPGPDIVTRGLLQATYTPIKTQEETLRMLKRTWEKCSLISQLRPSQRELKQLAERSRKDLKRQDLDEPSAIEKASKAIEIITPMMPQTGRLNVPRSARQFADIDMDSVTRIAERLIELRQEELEAALDAYKTILENFDKGQLATEASKTQEEPTDESKEKPLVPVKTILPKPSLKLLMDWAIENDVKNDMASKTLELAERLSLRSDKMTPVEFMMLASLQIDRMRGLLQGFRESMEVMPVGYLHLERLGFSPAGIERGELVYSVPLSPGEEVNITHKEWSHTSEEFERIVTDYMEEFSEEGVTEKSELAESVNSQSQHSTAFNTGVTASGSYGPVSITATVGYNASDSASKSEQLSRNQSTDITHKASSRSKKEHKMSFKVASAAETEDQTVRRIKNPYPDKATRVDYYQLIRKWQADLYRYGIRLTYDIVIPEPGSGILSKLSEIADIRNQLEKEFELKLALERTEDTPEDYVVLDDENYAQVAARYGAIVDDPPPAEINIPPVHKTYDWFGEGDWDRVRFFSIEVDVPEDVTVDDTEVMSRMKGETPNCWISIYAGKDELIYMEDNNKDYDFVTYSGWNGQYGRLPILIRSHRITIFHIEVRVTAKRREQVYEAWRLRAFNAIRDAAQAQYYENRQKLKERLARLEEELGAQDALSLRKREREEVMKGVLRWLGIPEFQFYLPGLPEELYEKESGLVKEEINIQLVGEHGEMIKFLHHAIEWENMLYFLYPYFWCDPGDEGEYWEFKKYLDHPDPMHRAFLKAGSARVVLTIRPGFEKAFLGFIETGDINQIPEPPYLTIAEEFENYAKTNYPGIPPANPVENVRPLLYPKQKKTWEDMRIIMKLLDRYFLANEDVYPATAQGLASLEPYTDSEIPTVPMQDQWDNNFVYTCPGLYGEYDLVSYGADGQPGGEGENTDITNWAEASLIGRWYEYTPTSALDIAFDEEMPKA